MTKNYTVIGCPVAHSLSPGIHQAFADGQGIALKFSRIEAPLGGFRQSLTAFRAEGGLGACVTLPFKEEAYRLACSHSQAAHQAQAANVLMWRNNHWYADNTDGQGLLDALQNFHQLQLKGAKVLILGAGGAASGILPPLLDQGPEQVWIYNRTPARAQALQARFTDIAEGLPPGPVDYIINATSASLIGEVPHLPDHYAQGAFCYDLFYDLKAPTAFVQWAKENGASHAVDGWSMLVEQAAAAFELWHGVRPETQRLIQRRG
jgi:shikimate dehydrogenase